MRRGFRHGVDLFIEDGAYTTVASAVSILVVLTLLFSTVTAVWSLSRAGDVQVAADATALAGSNVVGSYYTAATVVDAAVLSMGLAGFCVTGTGLVGLLIPGANAIAVETIKTGVKLLETRNKFATSASKGLSKLEKALPYLAAANATRTCSAQGSERIAYTGTALVVPTTSASKFPALEGEGVQTEALETSAEALDGAADELEAASQKTEAEKRRAWIADCGRDGFNMQERAGKLSSISSAENPDYASSVAWDPQVGIDRTRAYYRSRLASEAPQGSSAEAQADSAARRVFYAYAIEQFEGAYVVEQDGHVNMSVPLLPRNTSEVRGTTLYTDAVWPTTYEEDGLTMHYGLSCPGATGGAGPSISLAAQEGGRARECEACRFGVGDVGKTPAASTSIDNGYEYHLREYTLALQDYVVARNHELELERRAKEQAGIAGESFEDALATLANKRPSIAPPGRYGCLAFTVTGELAASDELHNPFTATGAVGARGALSASVLAPDGGTEDNNVLSEFFSSVEAHSGGQGAVGLIGDVMDVWGKLLVAYDDIGDGLAKLFEDLTDGLSAFGFTPLATWLSDTLSTTVSTLGLEPADLRLKKPVLTDSANVLAKANLGSAADAQELLRSLPLGSSDPVAVLQALGYEVQERISETTFTLAEIPLPGGGSIPITIRVKDLMKGVT